MALFASSGLKASIKRVASRAKAARKGKSKTGDSKNWTAGLFGRKK